MSIKPKDLVGSLVVLGFLSMIGYCVFIRVTPDGDMQNVIPNELLALAGPIITGVIKDKFIMKNGNGTST
jgi:hypothetical protein